MCKIISKIRNRVEVNFPHMLSYTCRTKPDCSSKVAHNYFLCATKLTLSIRFVRLIPDYDVTPPHFYLDFQKVQHAESHLGCVITDKYDVN